MACLFGHKWNGCKCDKCGKVRDEQHDWDLCRGKCNRCGKTRDEQHDWDGCKCKRCGTTRNTGHELQTVPGEESTKKMKCMKCGLVIERTRYQIVTTNTEIPQSQVGEVKQMCWGVFDSIVQKDIGFQHAMDKARTQKDRFEFQIILYDIFIQLWSATMLSS